MASLMAPVTVEEGGVVPSAKSSLWMAAERGAGLCRTKRGKIGWQQNLVARSAVLLLPVHTSRVLCVVVLVVL